MLLQSQAACPLLLESLCFHLWQADNETKVVVSQDVTKPLLSPRALANNSKVANLDYGAVKVLYSRAIPLWVWGVEIYRRQE